MRTLAFVVLRRVLSMVGGGRTLDAKEVEIAVLRHQLAVVRRQVTRPRYTPGDQMVLAVLARLLPRDRWKVFLVAPSTLLRWHRELSRRRWTYPATGRSRGLDPEVVELVLRLARDNARWGYMRIVGECRKLGVTVSATSVRTILRRHRLGPAPRHGGPGWTEFLRTQAAGALACDFLTVETVGLTRFAAAGIEVVRIPPRAPKANAYAERWVRTVRTECLDWVLVWNRRHLERVVAEYVAHYNTARPHCGIGLGVPYAASEPAPAGVEQIRRIERVDVLGGLVHEYRHAA
jgi:transposase InsO family protein